MGDHPEGAGRCDETRLRIVNALLERPLSVNDLALTLGVTQYNVSKHLRILREAGLVDSTKRGTRHEYDVAAPLRRRIAKHRGELDLGCCAFRFDRLKLNQGS